MIYAHNYIEFEINTHVYMFFLTDVNISVELTLI